MSPHADERSAQRAACPCCKGAVFSVPRRAVDLLLSIFIPVARFRCRSMCCSWEGNLRARSFFLPEQGVGESCARQFYVAGSARMAGGASADKRPR